MTPNSLPALTDSSAVLCIACILLVPFAGASLALINVGLGRSRSAGHQMLSSLLVVSVAAFAYFFCGFAWQGFAGGPAHVFTMGGKPWNWLGAAPFFLRGMESHGISSALVCWLGLLSCCSGRIDSRGKRNGPMEARRGLRVFSYPRAVSRIRYLRIGSGEADGYLSLA